LVGGCPKVVDAPERLSLTVPKSRPGGSDHKLLVLGNKACIPERVFPALTLIPGSFSEIYVATD